jgi:hypothetical protein
MAQKDHEGRIKQGKLALCVPLSAFVVNILLELHGSYPVV